MIFRIILLFTIYTLSNSEETCNEGTTIISPSDNKCCIQNVNACPTGNSIYTHRELECSENFECCPCREITCNNCTKFLANGDSSAFGTNITIWGNQDNGAIVKCNGDSSCEATRFRELRDITKLKCVGYRACLGSKSDQIQGKDGIDIECSGYESCLGVDWTLEDVENIKCTEDRSCLDATWKLETGSSNERIPIHIECSGYKSCVESEFIARDSIFENIICSGNSACANATFHRNVFNVSSNVDGGADIVCNGVNSCDGTTITGRALDDESGVIGFPVTNIVCSRYRACLNGEWNIKAVEDNAMNIECVAAESCMGLDISVNGGEVEKITCNGDFACKNAHIRVNNPAQDFQVKCKAHGSCQNMVLEVNVPETSMVNRFNTIKCEGDSACEGAEFIVVNNGKNDISIKKLKCHDSTACKNAIFNLNEGNNKVRFEKCKCKDHRGCAHYSGCLGARIIHPIQNEKEYQFHDYFDFDVNNIYLWWPILLILIFNVFANTLTCLCCIKSKAANPWKYMIL